MYVQTLNITTSTSNITTSCKHPTFLCFLSRIGLNSTSDEYALNTQISFYPKISVFVNLIPRNIRVLSANFYDQKNIILENCRTQKYHFDQILDPKLSDWPPVCLWAEYPPWELKEHIQCLRCCFIMLGLYCYNRPLFQHSGTMRTAC